MKKIKHLPFALLLLLLFACDGQINDNETNGDNSILSFSFPKSNDSRLKEDAIFKIDGTDITGTIKYLESNILKPVFIVPEGTVVEVKGDVQTSGVSEQDFTSPVIYKVISKDTKKVLKTYNVSVNFQYDKLSVTKEGVLSLKDPSNFLDLTGKLVLAEKMNGHTITSIGESAFTSCKGLTGDLKLPNSIVSIGEWAFAWCSGFTGTLTLPNSVTNIGKYAFFYCKGFTKVCNKSTINDNDDAFGGVTKNRGCP